MAFVIKSLAVLGAGQMGTGIAITAAIHLKIPVLLYDNNSEQLKKQKQFVHKILEKDQSKGKIKSAAEIAELINYTDKLDSISSAQVAIEAVREDYDLKANLLKTVEEKMVNSSFIASNTSSISITKLASNLKFPGKFIGMHFMNPVPVMELVEVITGLQTLNTTLEDCKTLSQMMKKQTVVSKDFPGFIANRILMPYINEAFFALEQGISKNPEEIDKVMEVGTRVPMGPLKLADFIGLDTCLAIMKVLHEGLGESKYRPSPLLVKYVEAGWFGKKTGKGVYDYPKE
jgi:3-hydroxybutyryl-CoA dehydrogenase